MTRVIIGHVNRHCYATTVSAGTAAIDEALVYLQDKQNNNDDDDNKRRSVAATEQWRGDAVRCGD